MKTVATAKRGWRLLPAMTLIAACITPWALYAQTPSPELIVDICTAPNKYWNKYVMLKGHVRSVTPNPPGTNRGSYVLRDSSDQDITVLTSELPAQGKEYTVSGNVEQTSPDSKVPVIREFRRVVGNEPLPQAAAPRRQAVPEDQAPVRRREPAPPPAPAPAPAAPQAKEVQPVVIQTSPPPESSGLFTPLIIAIVGLVILLAIIVVVAMRPKAAPAPAQPTFRAAPMPTAPPAPIRPPAPPPPTAARAGAPRDAAPTQVAPPPPPKATEMYLNLEAELSVAEGPDRGRKFPLTKPVVTLGRSGGRQNDIQLSDSTVSREHAKILYSTADKTFRLINESTTNPARLNGSPVDAVLVKDGDSIQLGATVLKFRKA